MAHEQKQAQRSASETELQNLLQGTPLCSQIPLFKIDSQGHWRYLNSPLPAKFSKLFSTILHRIEDDYFLVTPVEKVKVEVTDCVYTIVDYQALASGEFNLSTSIGTEYQIADQTCFRVNEDRICVELEGGLSACLGRACYYRYVDEFLDEA